MCARTGRPRDQIPQTAPCLSMSGRSSLTCLSQGAYPSAPAGPVETHPRVGGLRSTSSPKFQNKVLSPAHPVRARMFGALEANLAEERKVKASARVAPTTPTHRADAPSHSTPSWAETLCNALERCTTCRPAAVHRDQGPPARSKWTPVAAPPPSTPALRTPSAATWKIPQQAVAPWSPPPPSKGVGKKVPFD